MIKNILIDFKIIKKFNKLILHFIYNKILKIFIFIIKYIICYNKCNFFFIYIIQNLFFINI